MFKSFLCSMPSKINHSNFKNKLSHAVTMVSILLVCLLIFTSVVQARPPVKKYKGLPIGAPRWWKGNLHTHTLWSDGDDFPEMVAAWYKDQGYNFLAISDHNILQEDEKWIAAIDTAKKRETFKKYVDNFGSNWPQRRIVDGDLQIRLKPFNEYRSLLEEPDKFLLIQAEEITQKKAHVNAINLQKVIPKQSGDTAPEVMQKCIDAVLTQREQTGQLMFPHINHPNWKWQLTAEDMMHLKGEKFFEIYSGHPESQNDGDQSHASTERMWDIILTKRLAELNLPVMYGIATDDAHQYHGYGQKFKNPGRGWVMVKTSHLTPESIIRAMEAGDFYASTGVKLRTLSFNGRAFHVSVEPEEGVSYTIQFIGTLSGYDPTSKSVVDANGLEIHATKLYSPDIGKVLDEVKGDYATYVLRQKEIYVRAKIISTKPKVNPYVPGEVEVAWTQPVTPDY